MSFFGAFAQRAAQTPWTSLQPVLECTLNEAAWDGGVAMNLSSDAVSARGRVYDPRVVKAGWQQITREISLRAAGLASLSTSVTVADTDNKVRDAILTGDQAYSAVSIWRVFPGSATDYASLFTGLLDSWSFRHGQVVLHLKTDERALRSYFPAWPYLKSEWFWMAADSVGTYAPLLYGKHDSTALGLDHGMLPTVPVWFDATSAWYAVNLAPGDFIKDVYVRTGDTTVKQAYTTPGAGGNAYEKVYGSLAGGKIFTIIQFNGGFFPDEDAVVTCDAYGYAATTGGPSGLFDGSGVLTNPVDQLRSFVANFVTAKTRGYIPGAWSTTAAIVDGTSWTAIAAWAEARGLEGSRYMKDRKTALEIIREWLESFPVIRAFWNEDGEIELCLVGTDWPGYWTQATPLLRAEEELGTTFDCTDDPSDITGRISSRYLFDSVESKFLRTLDVEDLSSEILSDTNFDMYWSPARQV